MVWLARYAPEASAAMVVRSNCRESPWCVRRKPPLSITSAVTASLRSKKLRNTSSRRWMSSSSSWGRVGISGVLRRAEIDELVQQQPRNHVQRFKDAFAFVRGGGEGRHLDVAIVQQELHVFDRRGVGQVALVELQDVGDVFDVELEAPEIVREVLKGFDVLAHLFVLRVGD